jgi:hypothetical protein
MLLTFWSRLGVRVGLPEPSHPIPKSGMSKCCVFPTKSQSENAPAGKISDP